MLELSVKSKLGTIGGILVRYPAINRETNCETLHPRPSELPGPLNRPDHRSRLVYRFLVLELRHRIGHDARPRLDRPLPVPRQQRSNGDARIEISGKIRIEHRAAIRAAPRRLQFLD